jgi:putative spermidine/putrescine transport system substrate-binding protein
MTSPAVPARGRTVMQRGRTHLLAWLTAVAVLLGAGPHVAAEEACTAMQVYLSIEPQHREDVMSYIAPRLKKDLNVDLVAEAIGSAVMVERLTAQAAAPRISIAQWDVPIGIDACDRGMCKPIDLARVPNAQHLYDWAYSRDANGNLTVVTFTGRAVGFLYNADAFAKAKLTPPKSWKELASADYAGRLGLTAPQSTMGTAELVMLSRLAGGGEGNVDPGFATTKTILAGGNTVFTWSSEMSNLLQLGQLWVAVNSSNLAPALRASGLPIRFIWPTEGAPGVNGGMSLIKGAPCEAAAYDYMNLYFSPEFQTMRMRTGGGLSSNPDAWKALTPKDQTDLDVKPDDPTRLVSLDWRKINAARPGWLERWTREIH